MAKKKHFALLIFIAFLVGLFLLVTIPVHKDRVMRYRVNYAFWEAMNSLGPIVEEFYALNGRFPANNSELLNATPEKAFPAGGGCRIQQGGKVMIDYITFRANALASLALKKNKQSYKMTKTDIDYWIETEYNNQVDPSSFVSVGTERTLQSSWTDTESTTVRVTG